ncbi:MAG: nucleotidyltransferase family protein [Bacteroidaceae bacterium]|nr:nucleotidyltransferase family protein [Bacteroidaceae bacterium]
MSIFDIVTSLTASELFGAELSLTSQPDWKKVLECAHEQGVVAICYEAVKRLPTELQPDFEVMLRWDVSAEEVKSSFEGRRKVKEHLRDLFSSIGERMLLLKGETLAGHYPHPEMRECGDIDIMLPEGYEKGNSLIESRGIEVNYSNSKHSVFIYEGEEVELHDPIPHPSYNRNDYLTECLVAESLDDAVLRPDGCWELPPVVMAVHAMNHIALHLYMGEKVPLKMLADIALLLKAHPEVQKEWRPALDRTGLTKFSRTVLGAMDALFSTTFSGSTGNDRFIKLYVRQEGTKLSRILAKYRYLPRRPQEAFREMVAKLTRVIRHRLPL